MTNPGRSSADELIKTDLGSAMGMLGFAMVIATFLNAIAFVPAGLGTGLQQLEMRVICVAGSLIAFAIIYFAADFFRMITGRIVLTVFSALGAVAMGLSLLFAPWGLAFLLCMFGLIGAGVAACGYLWFMYACAEAQRSTITYVSVGFAGGCLLCALECFLPDGPVMFTIEGIWAVCIALLVISGAITAEFPSLQIPKQDSDKRSKVQINSRIMLATSYFQLGLVCVMSQVEGAPFCLGLAVVALVVLMADSVRKVRINERALHPFATPISVLVLACVCLYDTPVRIALLSIASASFSIYLVFGYTALARHVRFSHLSPTRAMGMARITNMAGLLLGVIAGSVLLMFISGGDSMSAIRISVGIAIVYSFIAGFCHKARFPEARFGIGESDLGNTPTEKGQWKKRCEIVSEKYNLSDRQNEVMRLISQGRNAEYVSQHLTISINTVQTHIRNIYQKTGVHSRQELLDIIENTKLYGED